MLIYSNLTKTYFSPYSKYKNIIAVFKTVKNKKVDSRITKYKLSVLVGAPIDAAWACWNNPHDIILNWYHASQDWALKQAYSR